MNFCSSSKGDLMQKGEKQGESKQKYKMIVFEINFLIDK